MCLNYKRNFFFYNKFKSPNYLEKISLDYKEKQGYIYVKNYNLKIDCVMIGQENNKKLYGKIVDFKYLNTNEILNKIITIISKNLDVKKKLNSKNKKYNFNLSLILEILNKYNWFNIVLDLIPISNLFLDRKYRLIKVIAYSENNTFQQEVNVII